MIAQVPRKLSSERAERFLALAARHRTMPQSPSRDAMRFLWMSFVPENVRDASAS